MYTPAVIDNITAEFMFRLLLADCETVQSILGAADATEALEKIQTDAPIWVSDDGGTVLTPPFRFPRILIDLDSQEFEHSPEGTLVDVTSRPLNVVVGLYVPNDIAEIQDSSDQFTWVRETQTKILRECSDLQGTGEPTPGLTHTTFLGSVLGRPERQPDDERDGDQDTQPDLSQWIMHYQFEVH